MRWLSPVDDRLPVSREHFDLRVNQLKTGLERFGYTTTHQQLEAYALEYLETRPGFAGLAFDLTDVGLG
jgi:hypothetical protein